MIEALIGHMKNDGLMGRNWLKGSAGDAMHVVLCAAGQNLRLILRAIAAFFARYLMGLNKHPEAEARPQRTPLSFAWLWDVAAMPQLADTRRFGIIGRTALLA